MKRFLTVLLAIGCLGLVTASVMGSTPSRLRAGARAFQLGFQTDFSLPFSSDFQVHTGTAAPSGTLSSKLTSTRGAYLRNGGSSANTLLYVTPDSGTTWTALAPPTQTNTDAQVAVDILGGLADAGTWTGGVTSGGLQSLTRTASANAQSYWITVPVPARTAASRGFRAAGLRVNYSVNTALVDDVRFELWEVTQGADNAARTAAVLFGDQNAHYDAAHDTAAERSDNTTGPELHLATVTAPSPTYLGSGKTYLLRAFVDGDAGAAGVVALTSAVLTGSQTLIDPA